MQFTILIIELILLYFLSRSVTKWLFTLFLLIFRARSVAISLLLVLEFPGTVIHELSHLFTAEILRVPTGKLTLVPESIREENIRSGSVAIAETDPFRRYAIGLAPIFWGLITLTAIAYLLPETSNWGDWGNWGYWGFLYLLFAVSNTMFSSSEDMKGFWPFAFVLTLFIGAGYYLGLRIPPLNGSIISTLTQSLSIVLFVNIVLLMTSWGLTRLIYSLWRH